MIGENTYELFVTDEHKVWRKYGILDCQNLDFFAQEEKAKQWAERSAPKGSTWFLARSTIIASNVQAQGMAADRKL